jgi:hypothetical protein
VNRRRVIAAAAMLWRVQGVGAMLGGTFGLVLSVIHLSQASLPGDVAVTLLTMVLSVALLMAGWLLASGRAWRRFGPGRDMNE